MPALTADVHRMHSVHQPQFLPLPVKAGARIYLNAITCTVDDNTVATVTSNSILLGKFTRPGSPGKWFVDIDRR